MFLVVENRGANSLRSGDHASLFPKGQGEPSHLHLVPPPTRPITVQLELRIWASHLLPQSLPSWHHSVTRQILTRTMVREAGPADSHGDPPSTRLHPVNNNGDTTLKCRQMCTSALLSITRVISYCCRSCCQNWVAILHPWWSGNSIFPIAGFYAFLLFISGASSSAQPASF